MGYRFVKISSYYDAFLAQYYARYPEQVHKPYAEQHCHLMAQGFAWADHVTKALINFGVEATEIVENALPLQLAWAKERGIQDLDPLDLLRQQLHEVKAEVLFVQDPLRFPRGWLSHLRSEVPSIRLIAGWLCAPYDDQGLGILRELDFVMTCTPGFLDEFRSQGLRTFHAYHAFAPSMLKKIEEIAAKEPCDLVFIGSLFGGRSFHDERAMMLDRLVARRIDVRIYGNVSEPSYIKNLFKENMLALVESVSNKIPQSGKIKQIKRVLNWRGLISATRFSRELKDRVQPPVFGLNMLRMLRDAKVAFNSHIGVAGRYAGNVRLFEATGVGTCLLTDWKENIGNIFCEDHEIVTYRSAEECVEKVRWLLDHPAECQKIAKAGQVRTLRDYTFERLAEQLDAHVRACIR